MRLGSPTWPVCAAVAFLCSTLHAQVCYTLRPGGSMAVPAVFSIRPLFDGLGHPETAARLGMDRMWELTGGIADAEPSLRTPLLLWLKGQPGVEDAWIPAEGGTADVDTPNDPSFYWQWNLRNRGQGFCALTPDPLSAGHDVGFVRVWPTLEAPPVAVGIIDSGVARHPDLNLHPVGHAPAGLDPFEDDCNHGTHVAGICAAIAGNGLNVAGVAPGALVVSVKVLDGCGGTTADYARGLAWFTDLDLGPVRKVTNASLQWYTAGMTPPPEMQAAVLYAHALGVVQVAASGNYNQHVAFPGRFEQVIAVGATNRRDVRPPFSNVGPQVDLCAPGEAVPSLSAANFGATLCLSGTSMASPHAAGAAALVLWARPDWDFQTVKTCLEQTALDLGAAGRDDLYGWGRLRLDAALRKARQ